MVYILEQRLIRAYWITTLWYRFVNFLYRHHEYHFPYPTYDKSGSTKRLAVPILYSRASSALYVPSEFVQALIHPRREMVNSHWRVIRVLDPKNHVNCISRSDIVGFWRPALLKMLSIKDQVLLINRVVMLQFQHPLNTPDVSF